MTSTQADAGHRPHPGTAGGRHMRDIKTSEIDAAGVLSLAREQAALRGAVTGGALVLPGEQPAAPTLAAGAAAGTLSWSTGPISFSGGVPVGGWSSLTLFPGGRYQFSGHFHVSGAPSYNTQLVWGVKSSSGAIYLFRDEGRVHGTFESGSRDHDWSRADGNQALAADFPNLLAGWSFHWEAHVN